MKDLAVLIPAFNDTPALIRTLDSIDEKENDFTVVIVDDGSRDPVQFDTSIYPFAIVILRQSNNGGIVKALNAGLEFIQAEPFSYIARLDAADLNRPNRFGLQYQHLCENSDLAMVGANVVFRDEDTFEPIFTTNLPLLAKDTRRWMVFRNCFIHPAVMFRVDTLNQAGLYDERYPHIEDYVFFSRIVECSNATNLEAPLVDCLIRKEGISRLNDHAQLISGLKFKLQSPHPLNPLWYAYIVKRLSYLVIPFPLRTRLKHWLGIVSATKPGPVSDSPQA